MGHVIQGKPVVVGTACAVCLASSEPLSFWGGYSQATGEIIDRRHSLSGEIGAGKIVVVPFTRGSSTTTGILLESVRAGVAPAGIITTEVDPFLALASVVAGEMYGRSFPVVAIGKEAFSLVCSGQRLEIQESGQVYVLDGPLREMDDHGVDN